MTHFGRHKKWLFALFVVCAIVLCLRTYYSNNNWQSIDASALGNHTSLAEQVEREVRVLCWVLTTAKYHKTRAVAVQRTWGKRCNRLVFVTSQHDATLRETYVPPGNDTYNVLWGKTKAALHYIYDKYRDEADWFLKADDDTYVFVENLRYFLYAYSAEMPIYFGHALKQAKNSNHAYMSGGGGYVLSSEALRRFVQVALKDKTKCHIGRDTGAEDKQLGYCLQNVGVLAGDSRDVHNKNRFLPFHANMGLVSNYFNKSIWWFSLSYYHPRLCADCLSEYFIAEHYINPPDMYFYEFFNYEFQIQGEEEDFEERLPQKINFADLVIPPSDNSQETYFDS